ncbi:MAG: NAD(P)-dependent oxidoreductase [Nitrosopumilaceae archaeon]|nr:NAD(P)-dependent oxidoreductase [Nitrosopumilaceae archaeon]
MVKIGIIGIGMLGNAVGLNLLRNNFQLGVFNRTKEKTKELEKNGAAVYDSPKEVAKNSDLVITIVKDAEAVKDVSFGKDGIIEGKHHDLCVADMSTINPIESKKIAKKFEENQIAMLDIPVMGGPNVAIKGELVLMAAGNKKDYDKFKSVFDAIASKNFFLGPNGTAHSVKLAMNLQIAMLAIALSEGITLARSVSVDPEIFLKILNSTYFKTGMSENKAYKMIKDEFKPTFTLKNLKKDLTTINETAKSFGIKLPMTSVAESIYQQATEKGFGDLDYTGILSFLKEYSKNANLQNDFKH